MGLLLVTSLIECLIFLPISFTIFQIFMTPEKAFLLSLGLCVVTIAACLFCRFKLKSFIYKIISFLASILFAFLVTGNVNLHMIIISIICFCIFLKVKREINQGKSISIQIALTALIFNILFAFIAAKGLTKISSEFINISVLISTISSVILLIIKQTDDSRRFGNKDMRVGSTQRKNNRIFAIVTLVLLFGISAIGQIQKIYSLFINITAWLLDKLKYLFGAIDVTEVQKQEKQLDFLPAIEQTEQSMLQKILNIVTEVLIIVIAVGAIVALIYLTAKTLIKLIKWIINWFRNGEGTVQRYYEDGHIDEKESLYNKNLNKMAKNIRQKASNLFAREVPYNKLNNIAKIRRLFKKLKGEALKSGVQIGKSSTAEEICRGLSEKLPEMSVFNDLMARCYAAARYGDIAPSHEDLKKLEKKLLK